MDIEEPAREAGLDGSTPQNQALHATSTPPLRSGVAAGERRRYRLMRLLHKPDARRCFALALLMYVLQCGAAAPADFFGTWIGDEGPWNRLVFKLDAKRVGIGPGRCSSLPYKVIEVYPSDEFGDYMSIEVDAPPDECRSLNQTQLIFRLRLNRDLPRLHFFDCPSREDLELLAAGKNRSCSGEAHLAPTDVVDNDR